jgi:hypothetical protein
VLVSNGGFDGANRVVGIPAATINRLISGQSVGIAMGSVSRSLSPADGDFDGNNAVEGSDFTLWQRAEGSGATSADANGDGVVNADDLSIWKDRFGDSGGAVGSTNFSIHTTESFFAPESAPTLNFDWVSPAIKATPEPDSIAMAAFYCMFSINVLRRRR